MGFVTVSTGLILPYWMGLPIRYIQRVYIRRKRMVLKVLRIVVKDICRLWDGHIDYPFFWADLPKGLDLYYNM